MQNNYGYNNFGGQGNQMPNFGGFSNPFANTNTTNNSTNMGQGYIAYQSVVPPQGPQAPPKGQGANKGIRVSKIANSRDNNPNKRLFRGKYELNAVIPIKYNTVDYFMLVENVRINNANALRELKRGKAKDILEQVLDSLEFLSYIHQ